MNDEPDGSGHREVLSALNTVEARRRIYFEKNLAGIYACTLSCDFLECNESFARMLGYASPTDAIGAIPPAEAAGRSYRRAERAIAEVAESR